ncbi:hypothetical protein LTR37_017030 [Vermiconidia calcicola]|uniref:Uncharacterized protein n=1 Tax=Vermiconidia calcicola TaxID=1690605 RepID=A0ACC3ML15_9PEZI|nr:hypothetical protein LTR37_017030 [Vermiconidia calcicola]
MMVAVVAAHFFLLSLLLALLDLTAIDAALQTNTTSFTHTSTTSNACNQLRARDLGISTGIETIFNANASLASNGYDKTPSAAFLARDTQQTTAQSKAKTGIIPFATRPSWPGYDVLQSTSPRDTASVEHVIAASGNAFEDSESTAPCTCVLCICRDMQIEKFYKDPRTTSIDAGPTGTDMLCLSIVFPWNPASWLATNAPECVYAIKARYGENVLPLGISGGILWHMTGQGPRYFKLGYEGLDACPLKSLRSGGYIS